jgi:hypothetical protein
MATAVEGRLTELAEDTVVTTDQIAAAVQFYIRRLTLADPFHPFGELVDPINLLLPFPEPEDETIPEDDDPLIINGERIPIGQKLIVWFNAFLPTVLVGLTQRVPAGQFKGKSMLPGPMSINDCFLTDNRGFSRFRSASCRVHAVVAFDLSGLNPNMVFGRRADTTFEIDCTSGAIECQAGSDVSRVKFKNLQGTSTYFKVDLDAQANNPCFTGSPDIEFNGTLRVVNKSVVMYEGSIGEFPAFEAYVQKGNGPRKVIYRHTRKRNATPMNLFNGATRQIMTSVNV